MQSDAFQLSAKRSFRRAGYCLPSNAQSRQAIACPTIFIITSSADVASAATIEE
jgi:hypothetical protein